MLPELIRYRARFYGCTRGAIGIHYMITAHVSGADPEDARLRLYERYDHVTHLTLTPLEGAGHDDHDSAQDG